MYLASSDSSATECFTVTTTSSGTSEQNWLPNDSATIFTPVGTLAGKVTIDLHSGTCDGAVVYTDQTDTPVTATTLGATVVTNNTTFKVTASNAGTYYWKIVFTPNDTTFATGFTKCETSTVTINNNP
ncbi:MAG: hypothetical protein E6J15_11190 [Chloroflexi bacterium]|nr:MAG: hypothetical protein E6J15_11190 [Chloroflexota bacterium]